MNQISEFAPRTTLHEELVGRLRDMIFSGELKGGDRVPEQKLCDMLGDCMAVVLRILHPHVTISSCPVIETKPSNLRLRSDVRAAWKSGKL